MTSARIITHCYRDPLSEIWLCAARKIGLKVLRNSDAFAHTDGKGMLTIAMDEDLDADDCLAQMIFHELCHSLVEGHDSFELTDWGLDNTDRDHDVREHATLRVQALLAGRYGLRRVLAPTTDFRSFYDELPADPLMRQSEACSAMARTAIARERTNPWWPHLGNALEATMAIVEVAAQWPAPGPAPSLYRLREAPAPPHPSGFFGRTEPGERCGKCAWRRSDGHCFQAGCPMPENTLACERFERPFDCQDCGACCRSAYHSVTIAQGDRVATRHPHLVIHRESYSEIRREDDHCAALASEEGRFRCTIYEDRPTCCREFENAGANCITARRRLGLSL